MLIGYILLFLGTPYLICQVSGSFTYGNASLLQSALLNNYYPPVRPNELINVTVNFGLYSLNALDTVDQRMSIVGFMVVVSTWMYDESQLNILTNQQSVNTDLYEENGEWELADTEAETGYRTLYGHPVAQVTFKLYFNRKYSYYILNLVLPIIFLTFLGCVTFYNPSEAGDRSDFAMTVLLSLTVFMTAVSDRIPTTSINVCILSVYLTCTLAITSSEVLACLILKQFHLNHENGQNFSPRMQKFTNFVGKIVSFRQDENAKAEDDEKGLIKVEGQNTVTAPESRADEARDRRKNQIIHANTPTVWEKEMSSKSEPDIDYTYKDLARIMDILIYYFFLILTSLITLIFFAILIFGDKKH